MTCTTFFGWLRRFCQLIHRALLDKGKVHFKMLVSRALEAKAIAEKHRMRPKTYPEIVVLFWKSASRK